ncbi:glycoside hydrolase family 18 [Bacteroides congonensis]
MEKLSYGGIKNNYCIFNLITMNKIINKIFCFFVLATLWVACDTEIENIPLQVPLERDAQYYENLRAYKKTKHQMAFGWFGGWKATGTSPVKYLRNLPDSVDVVSIWGTWHSLTPSQMEDLRYIQEVHGTRVTFTIFSHNMANFPGNFENIAENIPAAAKALADSIFKYGYDGIDFDHECSGNDLFNNSVNMTTLLREMRSNLGEDKLICVDGFVEKITEEGWEYADYAVAQAYNTKSPSGLQTRFNTVSEYISPDRFIVTENFEDHWATGGDKYSDPELGIIPSLIGMARWQPNNITEGQHKGGVGSYHMEYEYNHTDIEYKYLREAIQIMNPAKK